jgi:hypothetical protein
LVTANIPSDESGVKEGDIMREAIEGEKDQQYILKAVLFEFAKILYSIPEISCQAARSIISSRDDNNSLE